MLGFFEDASKGSMGTFFKHIHFVDNDTSAHGWTECGWWFDARYRTLTLWVHSLFATYLLFSSNKQTQLYKTDMKTFIENAKEHTLKNATKKTQAPPPAQISITTAATIQRPEDSASDSSGDEDDSSGSSSDSSASESDDDDDDSVADTEENDTASSKKRPLAISNAQSENKEKRPRVMSTENNDENNILLSS